MITTKILEKVEPFGGCDSPYYTLEHMYRGFASFCSKEYEDACRILLDVGFLKPTKAVSYRITHEGLVLDKVEEYFNFLKTCSWRDIPLAKPSLYKEVFGWPMEELITGLSVPVPGQETVSRLGNERHGTPGDLVNLGLLEDSPLKIVYPQYIPNWLTARRYQTSKRGQDLLEEYFRRYPKESAIRVTYGWDYGSEFGQFSRALRFMLPRVFTEIWQEIINQMRKIDPKNSQAFTFASWQGPFAPRLTNAPTEDHYIWAINDALSNPQKYAPRPPLRNLNPQQLTDLAVEISQIYPPLKKSDSCGCCEEKIYTPYHPQNP